MAIFTTMKWRITIVLALIGSMLALGGMGAALRAPETAWAQGDSGSTVVSAVNAYRVAHGLAPLSINASLMAAAQNHASWMAATRTYSHTGDGGSSPQSRANAAGYSGYVLENFFLGASASSQDAVSWWDTSPVHKADMLATPHTEVGAGFASNNDVRIFVLLVGNPVPPTPVPRVASGGAAVEEEEEEAGPPMIMIYKSDPREDGSIVHDVQEGQTLWDISAVYGVGLDQLSALNYLKPGQVIHPGDQILVQLGPGQTPPPPPDEPKTHIVAEGETIWEIAVLNGLTVDELLDLNGLTRADVLVPGTELRLTADDPSTAEPTEPAAPIITPTAAGPTPTPAPPA
ncbi:MAG TPA: LysM peptidoglycan-binding domain-containing protein [Aggregatilinea sp.]|uniref:LysM peptidoglycan-binding domain-containing protein n=1 Tax=Aggregatilinea sp. TaxID=2806333 RepID=UPI002BB30999|nr:LysM peptidoglycan-binding domain-containing protein [Aggregatilinea sp.]HML22381.1 LysM peptidoglycan-binding domain-containing protein [Aggregatilinea sp.]